MAKLHMEIVPDLSVVRPKTVMDRRIGQIIEASTSEDYSAALEKNDDWEIYYHLCAVRGGIVRWYPFCRQSRVLEIEGQFGAITGALCESCDEVAVTESNPYRASCLARRYRNRGNLSVYAGHVFDLALLRQSGRFDYIVLNGVLELQGNGDPDKKVYAAYLRRLRDELLTPDGHLLIAVENRLGLHYFCGDRDSYTGRPFDSINNYPFGSSARGFTKRELTDILTQAGLSQYRFFYPLPDHRLPQLIYSQDCTGNSAISDRLSTYAVQKDTQVAWERALYKDVVENGALEFMANSFLVECSAEGECCDINFVTLSTDRGEVHSFSTIIHNDGTVCKKPIYRRGMESLQLTCDAIQMLEARGIPVVPHQLEEDGLVMPYMEMPVLIDHLQKIFREEPQTVLTLLDRLYHYILASSELAPAAENALAGLAPELDFGPVLKNACIDMTPPNCFFDGQEIYFFDQEFVCRNFPARYIMYRVVKYTYMNIDGLESVIPQQQMKQRFWLESLWDVFEKAEGEFIASIRNTGVYHTYYRCVYPDLNAIHHRSELLEYKGENFNNYVRSPLTIQVQQVQMDLLARLQEVCDQYRLQYFMIYGTLLGAVRHNGFIPWDDDTDIAMPRKDYDRLLQLAPEVFRAPYFLQTMFNDPGCFYGGYSKLRNEETTALEENNWNRSCNQGISLDLFPIDVAYPVDELNMKMVREQCRWQRLIYAKTYGNSLRRNDGTPLQWKYYQWVANRYTRGELCRNLEQSFTACARGASPVRAIFAHYTSGQGYRCFDSREFDTAEMMDFGELRLPAPGNYAAFLTKSYGPNYLRYPPLNERVTNHTAYMRANVPYTQFIARFSLFERMENKDIVLYGNGAWVEQYLQRYGAEHAPVFIITDEEARWGTKRNGIEIKRPEAIGEPGPRTHRVILCDAAFEQLETKLQQMGCSEYAYFLPEMKLLWHRDAK